MTGTRTIHIRPALVVLGLLLAVSVTGWLAAAPEKPDKQMIYIDFVKLVSEKEQVNLRTTTVQTATVRQGDATFTSDNMIIKSERNPKNNKFDMHTFLCTGKPVFKDTENTITSDKVTGWSSPRHAEFIGNVKMVSDPTKKQGQKTETKSDTRKEMSNKPSTTTCDKLTYDYGEKRAKAIGNVKVVQEKRTVWAEQAVYDQNLELITLTGNVRMRNTGEEALKELYNAQTVTVSLETDWVDIQAKEGGRATLELEDKE